MGHPLPWREATERALYGPEGFYRRPEGPAGHFRTSVHASPLFAKALVRLAEEVDAALGHPDAFQIVDLGAGRGELLSAMAGHLGPGTRDRWRLTGVEVTGPPSGLAQGAAWCDRLPQGLQGLVVANEWLDDVPLDVAVRAGDEVRLVVVDPVTGEQSVGSPVRGDDRAWLDAWWPLDDSPDGDRAEIGRPRDEAWSRVVTSLRRGVAVAADYGHVRTDRLAGAYAAGTLVGYRNGRAVPPVPDGRCDITSHVAVDAVAAAGERAGATSTLLTTQRHALRALGVDGTRPPSSLSRTDPTGYLAALSRAGEAAELIAPAGLGGFRWVVQAVGTPIPSALAANLEDGSPTGAATP